jgi:hypothetical protein
LATGWLAIGLMIGCGGSDRKPTVQVTGEITFEGSPVTAGQVTFIAEDGAAASADLDSAGKFTIETLPIGQYTVAVTPPPLTEADDPSKVTAPTADNIPEAYQMEGTSDLKAEVKDGEDNHFTLNMVKGGGKTSKPMERAP